MLIIYIRRYVRWTQVIRKERDRAEVEEEEEKKAEEIEIV